MEKKNERFTVTIEDLTEDGAGIGRADGYVWFIKDTVIGDVVEAAAMKRKKTYGFARLIRVVVPSAKRVVPPCPVARQCGGCQLQAMSYEEGLRMKENKVFHNLVGIGGFKNLRRVGERDGSGQGAAVPFYPILGMDNPWRYRNKAQFPFGTDQNGEIVTGFYAGRTHSIIPQEDCLLGAEENGEILRIIKEYMKRYQVRPYDERTCRGLVRHVLIRKGFRTGQLMVCLVINGKTIPSPDRLVSALCKLEAMTSVSYCVNQEQTNVILGSEVVNLYGPGYIADKIGNVEFHISPQSFYQVNPVQTEKLYGTVLEYAGLTGRETVWDLYCGIGTISLFLAQKAGRVYGVEAVPRAVADARENARLNGFANVEFFEGRVEDVLPREYERGRVLGDVVVVDPPRKGCDAACLDTIVKMGPERVVYVSCNPATLARDLKYLCGKGYELRKVRCCDMFSWTSHVEAVAALQRAAASPCP